MSNSQTTYFCEITNTISTQKSHHETHLRSRTFKQAKQIKKLELQAMTSEQLIEKYNTDCINDILDKLQTQKIDKKKKRKVIKKNVNDAINFISSKEALKDKIHQIHNYLRNNGAGYGMNALKVFNVIYGLNRIDKYGLFEETELDFRCKFSNLLTMATRDSDPNFEELCSFVTGSKDDDLLSLIFENDKVKNMLYYDIPREIKGKAIAYLIKEVEEISKLETKFNVQLSGKVYEYFIGRDETAISELGAYFTDRHITDFIYQELLKPQPNEDGSVPSMVDMFGGSGGFTVGYAKYLSDNFTEEEGEIDMQSCIDNIYHYDMNADVIKSAALELFCITKKFPNMDGTNGNIRTVNSFKNDFIQRGTNANQKFHYVVTNPPYGGDKSKKTDKMVKRDKVIDFIKNEMKKEDEYTESQLKKFETQMKGLLKQNKDEKQELEQHKVTIDSCEKRIKPFANKYGLKGNDKESASLVLMMDCLAEGGTAVGVLKEGVFFNKTYTKLRQVLLENFNVRQVVSVPGDQFENTSTKTSIIVFDNTEEKTSMVEFSELMVDKYEEDKFELQEDGTVKIMECKDEIKDDGVYAKHITTASVEDILATKTVSLNGKDYNKRVIVPGDGYELVRLGDITEVKNGSQLDKKNFKKGIYPVYGGGNKILGFHNKYNSENSIIISGTGSCGNVNFEKKKFWASQCIVVSLTDSIKKNYINYMLKYMEDFIKSNASGSVQKFIRPPQIINLEIPVPTDPQKIQFWTDKISEPYYEKQTNEVRIKELEKEVQDRITEITETEDCEEVELGEVCEFKGGKFRSCDMDNKGIFPFYTARVNPSGTHSTFCFSDTTSYILMVKSGNIKASGIGSVTKVTGKVAAVNDIIQIKCKYYTNYLHIILKLNKQKLRNCSKNSVGLAHINLNEVKAIKIKIPKNKQLIEDMEPTFQEIEQLQEEVKNADTLYHQYLEELGQEAIKQ